MRFSSHPFKHLLVAVILLVVGIWRKCFARRKDGTVLLVAPTHPNSLGDEAMMLGTIVELRLRGFRRINVLGYDATLPWGETVSGIDAEFSYGGLSTRRRVSAIFRLITATLDARHLILIGADVLDGGYGDWHANTKLDMLDIMRRAGLNVHVIGFSFKQEPSAGAVRAFRELGSDAKFTLRDPASRDRFVDATKLPASLGADLAFLLSENAKPSITRSWIDAQRGGGGIVLGWNINGYLRKYLTNDDLGTYVLAHANLLSRLLSREPNLRVVLIPHDSLCYTETTPDSDPDVALALHRELSSDFSDRIHLAALPKDAATVAGICENLHAAVSCRMHLAIACLRAGVPVMAWEYQDKVTGLLAGHFEMPEAVLDLSELNQTESMTERIHGFVARRAAHAATINQQLPLVRKLARHSFSACSRSPR